MGRYPALYEKSDTTGMTYAFDPCIVSLCMYHFWLFNYGMSIGSLRKKYKEKARKDGEKDVDARYSYPNLYVAGGTKHAMRSTAHKGRTSNSWRQLEHLPSLG